MHGWVVFGEFKILGQEVLWLVNTKLWWKQCFVLSTASKPKASTCGIGQVNFYESQNNFTGVRYDQNEPLWLGLASFGSNLELPRGSMWAPISCNTNCIFTTKNLPNPKNIALSLRVLKKFYSKKCHYFFD